MLGWREPGEAARLRNLQRGALGWGVALLGSRARFQAQPPELNLLPPKGLAADNGRALPLQTAASSPCWELPRGSHEPEKRPPEVGAASHKAVPPQQAAPPPFLVAPDESETSPASSRFARWAVRLFFLPLAAPAVMMNHAAPRRRQPRRVTGGMGAQLFAEPISAWFYALQLAH